MAGTPFLLAIPAHLVVLGVGLNFVAVIIPATPSLAIGATTNELVRMEAGVFKFLLAVAAAAQVHQAAPNWYSCRSLWTLTI